MNTWLIKIGKAWAVIRRDGLRRGSRRVWEALTAFFRPIGSGDILFISGGVGDSARYRTTHVAEELLLQGFKTSVTVQDHPGLLAALPRFRVFVLHRTLVTPSLKRFIERAKTLHKELIFETDDLVYDPAYLVHMDYWHQMNALERKLYERGVGGEVLADPAVKVATTTTHFLAAKLTERGKKVFVVPNKLSLQDVEWADGARTRKQAKQATSSVVRVGYLSGTPSHNKDFATITPALIRLFQTYPTMRLVLAGPLDTESALNQFSNRIERLPFVPRRELFDSIASLDINLAPLEIGNPFCEAKSELKFFEAGIVGVPTVAAATDTFTRAISDGVDGLVAASADEWYDKISRLIQDEKLRWAMGEKARETALARYTTQRSSPTYSAYLYSLISS
ncbi:glycosyltransferase [Candidatus Dojkabacteria bacterium]|uniref:Glycosyltransferase n=1 Tax=Candidatus Dojkabacteria bacterium TaxID=2099670 RepID=A0A5C7J9Q7_9BACT|nr:MAG: glycosyltransferase [Candidatus Dojkabacteria bacterium]